MTIDQGATPNDHVCDRCGEPALPDRIHIEEISGYFCRSCFVALVGDACARNPEQTEVLAQKFNWRGEVSGPDFAGKVVDELIALGQRMRGQARETQKGGST